MKHFLITRFNLTTPNWKNSKNGELVLNDIWLKNRFKLFENYCFPSVKNQSNKNFYWFVFFDVKTPKYFCERIREYEDGFENFRPIFINGIEELNDMIVSCIKDSIEGNDKFIITTRLDNDDLIHKDFIKTIQSLYEPIDNTVIDLRRGYSITLGKRYSEIREYNFSFNPFISFIECSKDIQTVFSRQHKQWKNNENIIVENELFLWVELVHKRNMLNSTKFKLKRTLQFSNSDFGLFSNSRFTECFWAILLNNTKLKLELIIKKIKLKIK